ncbi:hypothetical protein HYQ50_2027 [Lactobacillus crispatus]|jgi:hypothetical protein|nr:hypothetical protein [Lactobacillus crispatus]
MILKRKVINCKFYILQDKASKSDEIISYLQNQKNKSKTVRLALLLAKKQFGNVDLNDALANLAIKNINESKNDVVSIKKAKTDKEDKHIQHSNVSQNKAKTEIHETSSKSQIKDKKVKPVKRKTRQEISKKREHNTKQLLPEDINKMLWDGDSSDL